MAYIKFNNGYTSTWDETIKIGELITTYNEGYHILTNIEYRDRPIYDQEDIVEKSHPEFNYSPLFHYIKVLKSDGTPSKKITSSCDASYCRRVTEEDAEAAMLAVIKAEEQKFQAILKYLPKD